jgi:hypothetical protein
MATKKRSGGPSTAEGKASSSKNALKLGFSSMSVNGVDEKKLVDEYVDELTNYYRPQSPLEKLQIQRIAICRAKLARLYETERVRMELVQVNFENFPEIVFKDMGVADGLSKSMALEAIRHGVITLPCDLPEGSLEAIASEVEHFHGELKSDLDFEKSFPILYAFVKSFTPTGSKMSFSTIEKLEIVFKRIYQAMRHKIYLGKLDNYFADMYGDKDSKKSDDDVEELMKQINPDYVAPPVIKREMTYGRVVGYFQLFGYLYSTVREARHLMERYELTKSLLVQSTLLPQDQADLFMRYQTTLERRLSNAIGELLELQKRRLT